MGGKTWSREEELLYWEKLIPNSPKRLGRDIKGREEKSWGWIAQGMTKGMGVNARRKYTPLCVFEHYFQNTYLGRLSPNIGKLANKYYWHEQGLKKQKEEERTRSLKLKEDGKSDTSSKTDATGGSDSPIEIDSNDGVKPEPIVINCQYPTAPSHRTHAPAPQSTVPSAGASFAPPRFLPPPPQYHHNQFMANHDRSAPAETVDGSLFMAQPPPPQMGDAVAPHQGYSYPYY
ncbi:hypothetical protein F5144DRAFT_204432 [Chaetomium tenue]|uniref:Uncharacterized protein n=1 Tax=Chaetomium tenue TaxID=1854479 RepID=A0ACB7PFI2_9PEZI|nr:hypothetical protein F5144DRAFT_204432 [Chaetomium globosum]